MDSKIARHTLCLTMLLFAAVASIMAKGLEDNVKLYIKFNELQGMLPQESISGKECQLNNNKQKLGEVTEDQIFGNVLNFSDPDNGSANAIRTTDMMPVSGTNARTISFWMKMESDKNFPVDATPNNQNMAQVISTGNADGDMNGFTVAIRTRRHLLIMAAPQTQIEFQGDRVLDDGWHHIAVVVNEGGVASECECYIDGIKLGAPKTYCGDLVAEKDFILNTSPTPLVFGQNFNGQISNFLLLNKALTKKEVVTVLENRWRKGEVNYGIQALADIELRVKARESEVAGWKNPFIKHMYTADPTARVFGDRLYVYASHDLEPHNNCDRMDQYHIFSTSDMINWKDHGEILAAKDVPWGRPEGGFMWAPDCAFRDGKYYFYYPHPSGAGTTWNTTWKIGVAISNRPDGGFDPRAEAAGVDGFKGYIEGMEPFIDPCVFIDDDGQAYIYQGGGGCCFGGKLKSNMVEIDGKMQYMVDVENTKRIFRGKEFEGLKIFHEGTWVFKRNDIYYLTAPDDHPFKEGGNQLIYYTSSNPLGPWKYGGVYLEPTGCGTSHGSVVEFKGQWYAFYHNSRLSGGDGANRSICVDKLFFNEDGSIQMVEQTF